jgi:ketosteroid isomerase-like protein
VAWVLATNAYLKTPDGWRLVLHHASPGQALEPTQVLSGNANVLH